MEQNTDRMGFALIALSIVAVVLIVMNTIFLPTIKSYFQGLQKWSNTVTNQLNPPQQYTHTAYANSADGTDGFYVGGGTNLLIGSDPTLGNSPYLNGVTEANVDGVKAWESSNTNYITFGIILDANTTYTYSALIKADTAGKLGFTSYGHFQVRNPNPHNKVDPTHEDISSERDYYGINVPANQWTKIYYTFTTNDLAGSSFSVFPSHANGHVYIRNLMLEEGTVAHPWSPAPSEAHPSYIGTYTDTNEQGSQDPLKYTWTKRN